MSDAFEKELNLAIKKVYTDLKQNELTQSNLVAASKLGVYYAHGVVEKAKNQLTSNQQKLKAISKEVVKVNQGKEVCENIITTATAAATDARNTNSLASTAAVKIQIAADSLTDLSADIAAVLAIVTAKDSGSKMQQLAERANQLTQIAAEKAESTTLQSLNTTIEAAQSRASAGLSQSKTLNISIAALTKNLEQELEITQEKIQLTSIALTNAIAEENNKQGVYKTAVEEEKAMRSSELFINERTNANLRYIKVKDEGEKFDIAFNAFDENKLMLDHGVLKMKKVLQEYRIIFTSLDDAPTFDIQAAKNTKEEHYFVMRPKSGQATPYQKRFVTAEYISAMQKSLKATKDEFVSSYDTAVDFQGEALKRGIPYVAFVYAEYDADYQNQMNGISGSLSLPSLPFILRTELPKAEKPKLQFYKSEQSENIAMRVNFKVSNFMFHDIDLTKIMDFKVILFKHENELAYKINQIINSQMDILFELDEAYRLAEQDYLIAEQAYQNAKASGNSDVKKLKLAMEVVKALYDKTTILYNQQVDKIIELNHSKISNFFLDEEILENIPNAFTTSTQAILSESEKILEALILQAEEVNNEIKKLENSGASKKEIKDLKKVLKEIEIEIITGAKSISSKGVKAYEAIIEDGAVIDNYGDTLMLNERYTALVYSTIKSSDPEETSLFQPVFSSFANSVEYTL